MVMTETAGGDMQFAAMSEPPKPRLIRRFSVAQRKASRAFSCSSFRVPVALAQYVSSPSPFTSISPRQLPCFAALPRAENQWEVALLTDMQRSLGLCS
jgi:hypothetical protein